jgi:small membrane protein
VLIQILLIASIVVVAALLGRVTSNARSMAFRRLFLLGFVAVSALAILFPETLTTIANWLGVGRGTDLLLYVLVIAFIGNLAMNSRRATELGRRITLLSRDIALTRAELEAERARGGDDKPE